MNETGGIGFEFKGCGLSSGGVALKVVGGFTHKWQ